MPEATTKKYFDPGLLTKVERLALTVRTVVEGVIAGMHKSPYHGFSVEFAEHREYVPGDEIRRIDWRVYAKSDKYYVKQYEEETNFICHVLLDASESMLYQGDGRDLSKLEYACFLTACLTYIILRQRDSAGLVVFDENIRQFIPPSGAPAHFQTMLAEMGKLDPEQKTSVGSILHEIASRIRKRGVVILISDLLSPVDDIISGLQHLKFERHEVLVFHVLDSDELSFPFRGMVKFDGLEEYPELLVEPLRLRESYLQALDRFTFKLRKACQDAAISYMVVDTAQPVEVVIRSLLMGRDQRSHT